MLFHAIAVLAILIGVKGFTGGGLPLTRTRQLTGTSGKIVGAMCFVFAAAVEAGMFWVMLRNSR